MLFYPKIPDSRGCPGGRCLAFEKYDGTNLHWDWDRVFGWHSFGTRRDAFNLTEIGQEQFRDAHSELDGCAALFLTTLADGFAQVFHENERYRPFDSLRVFTEYVGPHSFAGMHKPGDAMELRAFDIWTESFGMIGSREFVKDFGSLPTARVVYDGKFTGQFAEDVRTGKYGVAEGVICKGGAGGEDVWMVKIKTYAYLERLKASFGARWGDYWE